MPAEATSEALRKLKDFLNELFQFESEDLDFGIYRILNIKRDQIKKFIDKTLTETVRQELASITAEEQDEHKAQLARLEKLPHIGHWLKARQEGDTLRTQTYEQDYPADITLYEQHEGKLKAATADEATERYLYNHLAQFFSRYYDEGDFISLRRYGKNEKYVVPYNGEETHFYWANHDQYYIKSAENFKHYAFKVPHATGTITVRFKLTDAETEQGNVKAADKKYFIRSKQAAEWSPPLGGRGAAEGDDLTIFFEYRALAEGDPVLAGNSKQDQLNEKAAEELYRKLSEDMRTAKLWETKEGDDKTLLHRRLRHYTKKNTYDFFIHKDLKTFLSHELDFYIKSELVEVDKLYAATADEHYEAVQRNFRGIKVFKTIADTIIEFLAQLEDFQKKLWEKKKFVLSTQWVITFDRLIDYLGEEKTTPFIEEALRNEAQRKEWETLGLESPLSLGEGSGVRPVLKLPIDTIHFPGDFKYRLLDELSQCIDLEPTADGLVLHSDNFHGLTLLQEKFREQVKCIYIDPPYNTDASAILYKNSFKDSSWLSLIESRMSASVLLMPADGITCVAIDDEEVVGLRHLMNGTLNKLAGIAVVRSNPAGRKTKGKFAPAHEYALFYGVGERAIPSSLEATPKRLERFPKEDARGRFAWANFIRSGSNDKREDRPKLFYPIFVNSKDDLRIPSMEWDDSTGEYKLNEESKKDEVAVYPAVRNGTGTIEKNWQRGHLRVASELDEFPDEYRVRRPEQGDVQIDFKTRMDEDSLPVTWWDNKKYASANYGAAELKELFGVKPFDFPKAQKLVEDCLRASGATDQGTTICDYFPGSGSTWHCTQLLNRQDQDHRKCILIEQGDYFYTVILPRIKKVAYSFDWKDGKPKDDSMNGLGVFFKYQRLEQYEEALENIAITADHKAVQQALQFDGYMPRYFLQFETRNSKTTVNTQRMLDPWSYTLRVWNGLDYDTEQAVDLEETFNYLIGLHLHKCVTTERDDKTYRLHYGQTRDEKKIAVVWRNVTGWSDDDYKADKKFITELLKDFEHELLYVNHQSLIEGALTVESVFLTQMVPQ